MASSSRPKKPVHNVHNGVGQLRIIGGEWGSRKLSFPDVVGLRPTPDRVRETLFNWLAPYIGGAKVLDPFAGSGALFLEALSRGAAQAQALDASNVAVSSLKEHLGTLRLVEEVVADYLNNGPTQKELDDAKRELAGSFPLSTASNADIVGQLGAMGFYNLPLSYLEDFMKQSQALTVDQVKAAMNKHLSADKMVIVTAGPTIAQKPLPPPTDKPAEQPLGVPEH